MAFHPALYCTAGFSLFWDFTNQKADSLSSDRRVTSLLLFFFFTLWLLIPPLSLVLNVFYYNAITRVWPLFPVTTVLLSCQKIPTIRLVFVPPSSDLCSTKLFPLNSCLLLSSSSLLPLLLSSLFLSSPVLFFPLFSLPFLSFPFHCFSFLSSFLSFPFLSFHLLFPFLLFPLLFPFLSFPFLPVIPE